MMQALYAGIRMVALDLDRTTLRDDKSLSPAAAQAFRELIGQKGEFYRQYKLQQEALKAVGIAGDSDTPKGEEEEGH